ncbi:MAG: ABC transporter substrate-binding protein [Ruminococcaceae bacterium]|nr:ABC transporter substrate-binding protein [Oscillospiraceae bacterium]
MKIKKIVSFFLAGIMLLSFSGCEFIENLPFFTEDEPDEPPVIETPEVIEPVDPNWPVSAFGTEIEKAPEKVAVASPALAEYIYDMDLMEKVVAVSEFCGFAGAVSYPSIGSVRLPDLEAIKEAEPEYILTFSDYEENVLIEIQQMNVMVIKIEAPENLDELRALYKEIALFFKGAVDGVPFGENYVAEYDSALSALSYSGEQKTAAFIRALDYMMITGGTMEQELISAAGIKNAAEAYFGYTFPEENWKEFDPEVIFLNTDLHLIDLETNDLYKKKSAVKGDKVYNTDIDVLAIGSMRSFDILKNLLATLYEDYTGGTVLEPAYPSLYKQQ